MNDYLLITLISLFTLGLGFYFGRLIAGLKLKAETGRLEEKNIQLLLHIENLKKQTDSDLEEYKTQINQLKTEARNDIEKLEISREDIRREKENLRLQLTRKISEFNNLEERNLEQKAEVEKLQEKFSKEFENLANKILEQKSEKFTTLNKQNIENILDPLKEKIKSFEEKVNSNNENFIQRHSELGEQLRNLNEQNIKISEEANNLTKALKGENKTQGNWGELILEKVLEKSGLEKNREYFIQESHEDEDGNRFYPDVVIHLPNDKRMVIDSKVSLLAYDKYVNEEDKTLKDKYLKEHIKSLSNHIHQLSNKKYEDLHTTKSPDFVLMFIPIEPALYLAQNADNTFFLTAFQKNILLVSPTTLLSTLRTIDTIWSNEKQQQNALAIAKHASSLYHKFKILLDDLKTVGDRISSTKTAYDGAMKKLTGQQNLIKDIDRLEELGISPKQKINKLWLEKANLNIDEVGETKSPTLDLNNKNS
ncbi:DNA recombination protein RmuC [Christiangramia sabulilitoris]|uniref:DNA recombination protein RmuC n=1 Tax=Christiangramia sabulilitoris TaxID=2583991 RepID=A0A550I770_9FLAO|nr:DNA recombination protein RmuC [Christiangramia sabulilitoris]TRO66658.1 DNA recombination protein RmuC [Christiangramia sabulilitoris]